MEGSKVESANHLLDFGMLAVDVAKNLGISRVTLYRSLAAAAKLVTTQEGVH